MFFSDAPGNTIIHILIYIYIYTTVLATLRMTTERPKLNSASRVLNNNLLVYIFIYLYTEIYIYIYIYPLFCWRLQWLAIMVVRDRRDYFIANHLIDWDLIGVGVRVGVL